MNFLLWCVVASCALPYFAHAIAAFAKLRLGPYDNRAPREAIERLEGFGKRAWWAEQNLFEGQAIFVAIALVAQLAGADPTGAGIAGGIWVGARLLYIGAYVADLATLRSALFGVASLCLIALVVLAAVAG